MLKREFFLQAMKSELYKRKAWVLSVFALVQEVPGAWSKDSYPYRLIQTPTSYFFVNPDDVSELLPIDDAVAGQPLFAIGEELNLKANELVNLTSDITTTYGRVLFNYIVLINCFGKKISFLNTKVSPDLVESLILEKLKNTPINVEDRIESEIYVDEYLNFCDSVFYLTGFTQLCVPGATPKSIVAAPGIAELKATLFEKYKDRLHDPAIVALIDAELVAFDKAYLKGDLSEGFLLENDTIAIHRKKLFGMLGAEVGLEEKINVDLIQNSLSEGWDINAFPAMNNSLRAGSFNRGAETIKGGEAFKWLQRTSSNINVTIDDCGSKLGNPITVTNENLDWLVGYSVVTKGGSIRVNTTDDAKQYIGKTVLVRSPMYCKADKTDFCHTCIGTNLSNNPTSVSVAITNFGSVMMYINMKAGHSKGLNLAKMNYKESIF